MCSIRNGALPIDMCSIRNGALPIDMCSIRNGALPIDMCTQNTMKYSQSTGGIINLRC